MTCGFFQRGLLALLVVAFAGCDASDVVVFSQRSVGAGGSAGGAGMSVSGSGTAGQAGVAVGGAHTENGGASGGAGVTCLSSVECQAGWFCEKQTCDDAQGVCVPAPSIDDSTLLEVCGCDHITYFNDTLRKQYRISASTPKECGLDALSCLDDTACGPGATCSHWLTPMTGCGMSGLGRCWVIPPDCPATGERPAYQLCQSPGMPPPGPSPCVTTCQAIQSGREYQRAPRGFCP